MSKKNRSFLSTLTVAAAVIFGLALAKSDLAMVPSAFALDAHPASASFATLSEIVHDVEVRNSAAEVFAPAVADQKVGVGSQIRTGDASGARIDFDQGAIARLAPDTLLTIVTLPAAKDDPVARLNLATGRIWVRLKGGGLEVETPAGVGAVRGSYADFEYWPGNSDYLPDGAMVVSCLEGVCGIESPNVPLIVMGNLEMVWLSTGGHSLMRAPLGPEAVAEFIQKNPESADLEPTLTAAAPPVEALSVADASTDVSPAETLAAGISSGNFLPSQVTSATVGTLTPARAPTPIPTGIVRYYVPATLAPAPTWTPYSPWIAPTLANDYYGYGYPANTPIPTATLSPTPSKTVTPTITVTVTTTATVTPTITGTATDTETSTPTATSTLTPTPTATYTETSTSTPTVTPTDTVTGMVTSTPTATGTPTPTPTLGAVSAGFPTTITVNATEDAAAVDPGNGLCETAPGNHICTLRAAIQVANAAKSGTVIELPAGTYLLTQAGPGEDAALTGDLDIRNNLTLVGAGDGATIIDASRLGHRVLNIGLVTTTVQISGVTIQNAHLAAGDGGGIRNSGTLTVNSSSLISNAAPAGQGGGLFTAAGGATTLVSTTVSSNLALSGGGLVAAGKAGQTTTLTLDAVSVISNTASSQGSALVCDQSACSLTNVTVSGNLSAGLPAILSGQAATLSLTNVTLANNALGLSNQQGSANLKNTLLADNVAGNCSGLIASLGHNLDDGTTCGLAATGDISGTQALLAPLGNYGGPTLTHRLQTGSPALNAGDNTGCPAFDQRGVARPQNGQCDIGAVEDP